MKKTEHRKRKSRPFLVIELLNAFSKKELEDFTHFVSCTYFNADPYVSALFEILKKEVIHKAKFDDVLQSMVYQYVFSKKPKPKGVLNQQQKSLLIVKMNILMKVAESFLCNEGLRRNNACKTELLYKELLDKNQFWLFNRRVKKDKKLLAVQSAKDADYYAYELKMQMGVLSYLDSSRQLAKEDNLKELNTSLDMYYLLNKLSLHITGLYQSLFFSKNTDLQHSTYIISTLLKSSEYKYNPFTEIYKIIIDLMNTNDLVVYDKLIALLDKHTTLIPANDLRDFYVTASNFCVRQIRQGNLEYYQNWLELYETMDAKDILVQGDYISPQTLRNVVTLGCRLDRVDWALEVLEKYSPTLKKEYRKSVRHFNIGTIEFHKSNYKEAIRNFIRVDKVNLSYDVDCRIMMLQAHYELDTEYDERTMHIFRMAERFMQNNRQLVSNTKKAYVNFIRILINLYRFRHGIGKMNLERIQEKLNKKKAYVNKSWLLEKIEALKKEKGTKK